MPQVTLSVPRNKMPLFKQMLALIGVKNKAAKSSGKTNYATTISRSVKNTAGAVVRRYFSWDNNRNELEFE